MQGQPAARAWWVWAAVRRRRGGDEIVHLSSKTQRQFPAGFSIDTLMSLSVDPRTPPPNDAERDHAHNLPASLPNSAWA
jgi:hypothetical protein